MTIKSGTALDIIFYPGQPQIYNFEILLLNGHFNPRIGAFICSDLRFNDK